MDRGGREHTGPLVQMSRYPTGHPPTAYSGHWEDACTSSSLPIQVETEEGLTVWLTGNNTPPSVRAAPYKPERQTDTGLRNLERP